MNKKKIRIGILGGSFNPPHSGHVFISRLALKKLKLKQVWWIVSPQNPLKKESISHSFEERLKLCKELTRDIPDITVSNIEKRYFPHAKRFYSYNLIKRLNEQFPSYDFYFITGADSLINLHKWYRFRDLGKICKIVVFDRKNYRFQALASHACKLNVISEFFFGKTMDISSTEIRNKRKK